MGRSPTGNRNGTFPHSVISASAYVIEFFIRHCSPEPGVPFRVATRENDYSLNHFFDIDAIAEGEGENADKGSLRGKISGILNIDILKDDPLASPIFSKFDVIRSCLFFEAAAQTIDDYKTIASDVKKLLRNGGYLVLYGYLENDRYQVGDEEFLDLPITGHKVNESWKGVGMEIIFFEHVRGKIRPNFIMVAKNGTQNVEHLFMKSSL